MNDDNKTPLAYQFRMRMNELLDMLPEDGAITGGDWDPDAIGFSVFGGDPLLQRSPSLVADIIGYELGGEGITEDDLDAIISGMRSRSYADEFNRD